MPPFERVVVIGDGGWGTALALLLHQSGIDVTLWSAFAEQAEELRAQHENRRFLPGVPLPEELKITADPFAADEGAERAITTPLVSE